MRQTMQNAQLTFTKSEIFPINSSVMLDGLMNFVMSFYTKYTGVRYKTDSDTVIIKQSRYFLAYTLLILSQ